MAVIVPENVAIIVPVLAEDVHPAVNKTIRDPANVVPTIVGVAVSLVARFNVIPDVLAVISTALLVAVPVEIHVDQVAVPVEILAVHNLVIQAVVHPVLIVPTIVLLAVATYAKKSLPQHVLLVDHLVRAVLVVR